MLAAALVPRTAAGQPVRVDAPPSEAVEALRGARDYAGAARLLAPYVRDHPEDARSWLDLAQNLYWAGDVGGARVEFERAVAAHPGDVELRRAYGRLLVDLNEGRAARGVLVPLLEEPPAAAEAERLLGTLAYWEGDLTAARRRFRRAVRLNGEDAEALRQLREIGDITRPWVSVCGGLQSDTQPLDGRGLSAEAGLFLTPLQAGSVRASSRQLVAADSARTVDEVALAHKAYWPALRLETEMAAGVLRRSEEAETDWTGRVSVGVRLPHDLTATAAVERAAYLYTEASLREPVTTETAGVTLSWAPTGGWSGQAALQLTSFPDDNVQRTAYVWALAPLVESSLVGVQAGYAFSYQHADDTRYTAVLTAPPRPRQPAQFEGRYAPYYTPNGLRAHSATGALQLRPHRVISVHAGGSYGVHAVEQAPYVYSAGLGRPAVVAFYENRFHPWEARAAVQVEAGRSLSVGIEVSHTRTAYYDATQGELTLTVRVP